jgi:uncharacterized protein (TIGR02266 family)
MKILVARYRSGADFLDHYQSSFLYGGVFYPTRKIIEPGELVVLDVRMPALPDYTLIRGMVAWHRRGRRSQGTRAGLGIEFLASEQKTRDYVLALARGTLEPDSKRRHRRLPTEIRVDWRIPNESDRHLSYVEDIGAGGLFLRTRKQPAEGTSVVVELVPPGATAPQIIEGRVAWTSDAPGSEGVGVEFRCRDIGGMRRLRELVRRIERDGAAQLS